MNKIFWNTIQESSSQDGSSFILQGSNITFQQVCHPEFDGKRGDVIRNTISFSTASYRLALANAKNTGRGEIKEGCHIMGLITYDAATKLATLTIFEAHGMPKFTKPIDELDLPE